LASFAVELQGTQEHRVSLAEFAERHREHYGEAPPGLEAAAG
jgi:hypothetical protein